MPPAAADAAHASSRRVLSDMFPYVRAFASNHALAGGGGKRNLAARHLSHVSNDRRTTNKSHRSSVHPRRWVRVRFLEARAKMDPFSSLLPPQAPQQSGALAPAMQQQSAQPALASLQQQSAQPGSYGGSDEDRRGVMSLNANLVRACCVLSRAHLWQESVRLGTAPLPKRTLRRSCAPATRYSRARTSCEHTRCAAETSAVPRAARAPCCVGTHCVTLPTICFAAASLACPARRSAC
jgi:hypothetical protein